MIALLRKDPDNAAQPRREELTDDGAYMAALYQKYKAFLFRKAGSYTKDPQTLEDIVQDAVLRLLRNTAKLRTLEPAALTAYLALTVRSAALNHLAAERRDTLDALPLDDGEVQTDRLRSSRSQPTLEEQVLLGLRDRKLRTVIGRLPERDQTLLTGKYFLELSTQELADDLGTTAVGVRVMLSRARKRAMNELMREGILHG